MKRVCSVQRLHGTAQNEDKKWSKTIELPVNCVWHAMSL